MITLIYRLIAVVALGMAALSANAGGVSCITADTLNISGDHTKIIPFGCEALSTTPFTFPGVADGKGVLHDLTINTFEQFASHHGKSGVYIDGTIDSIAFSGIGGEKHPPHTFNFIAKSGVTYDWTVAAEMIKPITLPADFRMQLDPTKTSGGTLTVTDLGNGLYDVSNTFSLFFEASLNSGLSYVSIDPAFSLQTFDESTANQQIKDYLAPVPLPAALPLMLSGLGVLGFASRRRKNAAV